MTTVYLGLGSNIGNSRDYIEKAVSRLSELLSDIKQAPFYLSKAVGYTDQPDFLNTAVSGQTDLEPAALLSRVKSIEQDVGRTASFHWGPRQIDIDIIFYGDQVIKADGLVIPHPRFRDRDFVLRPLSDLNAALIDPVSHKSVKRLLSDLPAKQLSIV